MSSDRVQRDRTFLAEATLLLSQNLDPDRALANLARLATSAIADWCLIHMLDGAGRIELVAQQHVDVTKLAIAEDMIRRFPPDESEHNRIYRVLHGGRAEVYPDLPDDLLAANANDPAQLAYLRSVGYQSAMVVPMLGRRGVIGTITLITAEAGRRYDEVDLAVAEDLGRRAGLAIENARLFESEREARRAAERAADRTARLYRLAIALGDVIEAREVAEAFVGAGRAALGAQASHAWLLDDSGTTLDLAVQHGELENTGVDGYRRVAVDAALPICDVLRTRAPMMFSSLAQLEARYPEARVAEELPFRSWAVVPLLAGGRGIGAAAFSFLDHRDFPAEDQAFVDAMTRQAALAFERCRLFEAERRATEQAKLAERRKDEFLAMLGHELRNPLAPLATAVELMRARDPTMFRREREVIERQVAHLSRLLDDLLDISRITRGKIELDRQVVDIAGVVAKAVEMASPLYEKRRHHLRVEVPRGLRVDGDPVRLAQVFQNLLTNAAKYTAPEGHVTIAAALADGEVVVRVRDDGVGIAAEVLPAVFELFVQGDRSLDRSQGGLGIGLTVVKRLVELHGGTVEARSDGPGHGTEMLVRLPAADSAELAAAAAAATRVAPSRHRRVLIVDDNPDAAEVLGEYLRELGYEIELAGDGPTAIARAEQFHPHVAVLDLGLPVMDGYELAQRLRERWSGSELRLIAVTGYGQDSDRARSCAAGFDEHLVKPVDLGELERALDE